MNNIVCIPYVPEGAASFAQAEACGRTIRDHVVALLHDALPGTAVLACDGSHAALPADAAAAILVPANAPGVPRRILRELAENAKNATAVELISGGVWGGEEVASRAIVRAVRADGARCACELAARDDGAAAQRRENVPLGAIADSPLTFALVAAELRRRQVLRLLRAGVTILDPETVHVDATVTAGRNTIVHGFVTIRGDVQIGEECVIESFTSIEGPASVGDRTILGPFARLRSGTRIGARVKIGNFVEIKESAIGDDCRAKHLSYIGNAELGRGVNIGAGTITCNYDGVDHHDTKIGARAFIGSDTQLVAPVQVGAGAFVGAGSTIVRDVPPDGLALSRTEQTNVDGWAARRRERRAGR